MCPYDSPGPFSMTNAFPIVRCLLRAVLLMMACSLIAGCASPPEPSPMLSEPVRYGDFSADVLKGDLLVASARDESELVYTIPNFPEGVRERGPRAKWLVLHVQYHGEGTFSGLVVPVERKRLTVDEVFRSGVWYASETALAVIVRECRIDPDRVRSSEKFIDECPGWLKDFELPLPPQRQRRLRCFRLSCGFRGSNCGSSPLRESRTSALSTRNTVGSLPLH